MQSPTALLKLLTQLSILIGLQSTAAAAAPEALSFDPYFSNGLVLQQGEPTRITGGAPAGATVQLQFDGLPRTSTRADDGGRWAVTLTPTSAGLGHTIRIESNGAHSASINDVAVGEVWICSGQSNIEMSVETNGGSPDLPTDAMLPIRQLKIKSHVNATPEQVAVVQGAWAQAQRESVGKFSAACYYFAQDRIKTRKVPIGLVLSAVGATSIQPWLPVRSLSTMPQYSADIENHRRYELDPTSATENFGRQVEEWARKLHSEGFSDSGSWERYSGAEVRGLVWYRADFDLDRNQLSSFDRISMPQVFGGDTIWINGRCIGAGSQPTRSSRSYSLPPNTLKIGRNSVLVLVDIPFSMGGISGKPAIQLVGAETRDLTPLLRARNTPQPAVQAPKPPWHYANGIGGAWNAMLQPLRFVAARGLVWYQGEGNTRDVRRDYEDLLTALLANVRQDRHDFRALIVQLPSYQPNPPTLNGEGWSLVREAQRKVAMVSGLNALVVTIDQGQASELHPKNKMSVGQRLSNAASGLDRGIKPAGTQFAVRFQKQGDDWSVVLDGAGGKISSMDSEDIAGFEYCHFQGQKCTSLKVRTDGKALHFRLPPMEREGFSIRYCWGDNPSCTLKANDSSVTPFVQQYHP